MDDHRFISGLQEQLAQAPFIMLRWETEKTPCTGITAVSKQERRHFRRAVTIAPWCGELERKSSADDPLQNGQVRRTGWRFPFARGVCEVLATTDEGPPVLFLDIPSRCRGRKTPYDVPPELPEGAASALKRDALYFGLAVEELLKNFGSSGQFIWGADWESVPALLRLRDRHLVSLTLHNTFDKCFEAEATEFTEYAALCSRRPDWADWQPGQPKTALEIGMEMADVVTAVNRGFARGMRIELLQRAVMIPHLPGYLLDRVVGINNAAFSPLAEKLVRLKDRLVGDFAGGCTDLFKLKSDARAKLLADQKLDVRDKVVVVSMGRRGAQKQHDVLVESVRQILRSDPSFPMIAFFATTPDEADRPRLERIQALAKDFEKNVLWTDDRLPYYQELMEAADFNCMPSLYEPHGGAYEGTVVPIARAIDGLAEQICPHDPSDEVQAITDLWHSRGEAPTGFLFRESPTCSDSLTADLEGLLRDSPSPDNELFRGMRDALTAVLRRAVCLLCKSRRHASTHRAGAHPARGPQPCSPLGACPGCIGAFEGSLVSLTAAGPILRCRSVLHRGSRGDGGATERGPRCMAPGQRRRFALGDDG